MEATNPDLKKETPSFPWKICKGMVISGTNCAYELCLQSEVTTSVKK